MKTVTQTLESRQDASSQLLKQLEDRVCDNNEQLIVLVKQVHAIHDHFQELQETQIQQTMVLNELTCEVSLIDSSLSESQQLINNVSATVDENVVTENAFQLALTALKHLCWQVPTMLYRIIFAELFPSKSYLAKRFYSYRELRVKIANLNDSDLRREKSQLLADLVHLVGWNDDMEHIINQLLEEYELQPILKHFELDNTTVDLIFTANILTGDEVSTVHEIVDVWQRLTE